VDVVTVLWAGQFGVRFLAGERFFASPKCPDQLQGPPNLIFSGYWGFFQNNWGVKFTSHLHCRVEVKNEWSFASASLYAFMVWTGMCLPVVLGTYSISVLLEFVYEYEERI
jgi:hypothetical protein